MAPTANVVATLEPATAAKIMQVSTQLMASPPCIPPTRLLANSTMRSEIPLASIRLPARMKKGTATSGYLSRAAYTCWATTSHVMPSLATPSKAAKPIETATGTETVKKTSMDTIINCDMPPPAWCPWGLAARRRTPPGSSCPTHLCSSLLDSCLCCSDHRVVHGWRLCHVEPAGEHAKYRQAHANGNGDVDP